MRRRSATLRLRPLQKETDTLGNLEESPMKFDWQPKTTAELSEFEALCQRDRYRVVRPSEIPSGTLSPALLGKCHSVLVVCSGTESGRVYWMLNLNRIDGDAID